MTHPYRFADEAIAALKDSHGDPSPTLEGLLKVHNVKYERQPGLTWKNMVAATQKAFHRFDEDGFPLKRQQIDITAEDKILASVWDQSFDCLAAMGWFGPFAPRQNSYSAAVLHGTFPEYALGGMKLLAQQWNAGVRFGEIVILSGTIEVPPHQSCARLVSPSSDTPPWQAFTEVGSMLWLWEQLTPELPEGMSQLPLTIISSPDYPRRPGEIVHVADTRDSLVAWIACCRVPEPEDSFLAISATPMQTLRQQLEFLKVLQEWGLSECVVDTLSIGRYRDSLFANLRDLASLLYVMDK